MKIGIPKEIKILEGRVALIPAAAAQLVHEGHTVFIESGAGDASGYSDKAMKPQALPSSRMPQRYTANRK